MWIIQYTKKAAKQAANLPKAVLLALDALALDIKLHGPVRGNWPNYSKLSAGVHHCHLKKGHPTYVAVWEEVAGKIQIARITYAGTHEKAPY